MKNIFKKAILEEAEKRIAKRAKEESKQHLPLKKTLRKKTIE